MSSNSFVATLDLNLRPSMRALKFVFMLHILPVGLLPFAMQSGAPMFVLLGAFLASWIWTRRHAALGFGPRALLRLVWHVEGHWTIYDGTGRAHEAQLLGSSYVHPALLVLRFELPGGERRTRLLAGGECDEELLRRLRARLAVMGRAPASAGSSPPR